MNIARLVARLPEGPPALALAGALNLAVAAGRLPLTSLEGLRGKVIRIEAPDLGLGVGVMLGRSGFRPSGAAPDVTIRARLADYARLALRREDPDTLFFSRQLVIEGDTELGLVVKNALDSADW